MPKIIGDNGCVQNQKLSGFKWIAITYFFGFTFTDIRDLQANSL